MSNIICPFCGKPWGVWHHEEYEFMDEILEEVYTTGCTECTAHIDSFFNTEEEAMEAASRRADGWIQLPCKEGTTVFELRMGEVEVAYGYHEPQYGIYEKRFNITDLPKIGKTIFLSHNEAKAVWRVKQYGDHSDRDCCW